MLFWLVVAMLAGSSASSLTPSTRAAGQPNIIFILTDDMRADDVMGMPYLQEAVAGAGMSFNNAFVTTPICCPSRASTLRGQYTHNHGIWSNKLTYHGEPSSFPLFHEKGLESSTVATWLHDAGYRTALIGKYLNNYPEGAPQNYIPPGWDEWNVQLRGRYFGFQLLENGSVVPYPKRSRVYATDVYTEKAVDFVTRAAQSEQPFFLFVSPHAPHYPATPAPRHEEAFPDAVAPRGLGFNEADVSDKPHRIQSMPPLTDEAMEGIDVEHRSRLQTLLAVDEMIAAIDETLIETGAFDNTYVFFTSDNGYFLGEHRLPNGKAGPYDEAVRMPLVVRGPGVPAGHVEERLVLNADLAPTFAELAGTNAADFVDGRSFVPLLHGVENVPWRSMLLVEFAGQDSAGRAVESEEEAAAAESDDSVELVPAPAFRLLATESLRYIEYDTGEIELYDVTRDPAQIDNLAAVTPAEELQQLSAALAAISTCAADSCRAAEDAPLP